MNDVNPASIFGFGTWTQIVDKFLYCTGENVSGNVGGEASHTLTVNEMPSHSHAQYVSANNGSDAVRRDYDSDGGSGTEYYGATEYHVTATRAGYENYTQIQDKIKNSNWIQYDDFQKYYGFERSCISFLTVDSPKKCYFKTLKSTDISYFE